MNSTGEASNTLWNHLLNILPEYKSLAQALVFGGSQAKTMREIYYQEWPHEAIETVDQKEEFKISYAKIYFGK